MRNRSPRPFTVEVKSGGRDQRTMIPHRAAAPTPSRPAVSWPPPIEPRAPVAEPRRILPNLIVLEASSDEPELTLAEGEHLPRPRRGRSPKAKPVAAEMTEELIAEPTVEPAAIVPALPAPEVPESRPVRPTKQTPALPLGERWKRRLGRWAR